METTRPPHKFLRSVHNIRIERGWRDLRKVWGLSAAINWEKGGGIYDEDKRVHRYNSQFTAHSTV